MTYAKYISNTKVEYPDYSAYPFKGIPNAKTNDKLHRMNGYLPLIGEHGVPSGYTAIPSAFTLVEQIATHSELRDRDPNTGAQFIVKVYDENDNLINEHSEWQEVEITTDNSYIQIDGWTDEENVQENNVTTCTKYELINCLKNYYPELLEVLKAAYVSSQELAFYWNSVMILDRNNVDFQTSVAALNISDAQLDEIFSHIDNSVTA